MQQLVFATNNANKLAEVRNQLQGKFEILSLQDIGCHEELPETTGTIPGNAQQKAQHVFTNYKVDCFADDTGLEVEALSGEPGVDSAFYAGPHRSAEDNIAKVLENLKDKYSRSARFRTVIAMVTEGKLHLFEGIAQGSIIEERVGKYGFGYDPIFRPKGYDLTFAEMGKDQKNKISHRAKAVAKLVDFLLGL